MPENTMTDPKRRKYSLLPSVAPGAEELDIICQADPGNPPYSSAYPEIRWSEPKFHVGAYNDEEVLFEVRDATLAGEEFKVDVLSSTAAQARVMWSRTGEGCRSPAFRCPEQEGEGGELIVVELTLLIAATGSKPGLGDGIMIAAPTVMQAKRRVKIIWTPHAG